MTILDHNEWIGVVYDLRHECPEWARIHVARDSHPAEAVAKALYHFSGSRAPVSCEAHLWTVGLPNGSIWEGEPVYPLDDRISLLLVPAAAWDIMDRVKRVFDLRRCISLDTYEEVLDEIWLGKWTEATIMAAQARHMLSRAGGHHMRHFGKGATLIHDQWMIRV